MLTVSEESAQVGGTTLAGATVRLVTFGLVTTSDAQGRFTFWIDVPPPCIKIDMAASAPGFGPWRDNGEVVEPGISVGVDIELDTSSHLYTARYGGAAARQAAMCSYPASATPPATSTR